jgi:DNA polymerase III delta prime subunit
MPQLWQQSRLKSIDEMVGNVEALAELRKIDGGMILIHGPIGVGKTSLALAYVHEKSGRRIEECERQVCLGSYYVAHVHANDFEISEAEKRHLFFNKSTPTWLILDEAHLLTEKRQQSRLKTIPYRPELTIILVTQDASALEKSILDRCTKIRLGPLSARELPELVRRACASVGIEYKPEIVQALNRAECLRPRAILNAVEALAHGRSIAQAIAGQA